MENYDELIKALRKCGKASADRCWDCTYYDREPWCESALANDAADALEEQQKQIEELERNFSDVCNANGSLACERNELLNDVRELEAQIPKEGEWIMDCLAPQMDEYRIGEWAYAPKCSECGTHWDAKTNYCPNCGAKMTKGEQDE